MKITKENIAQTNWYTWRNDHGREVTIPASSRAESSNKIVMSEEYKLDGNCRLVRMNGEPIRGKTFWCFTTYTGPNGRGYWHHEYCSGSEASQARKLMLEWGWVTEATKIWKEAGE